MEFKYYEHGVCRGDVRFDGTGVHARFRDGPRGAWREERETAPSASPGSFPFGEAVPLFDAFRSCRREAHDGKAVLPDGRVYEAQRNVRAGGKSATVWAVTSDGPVLDLAVDDCGGEIRAVFWTSKKGTAVLAEDGWECVTPAALWDDGLLPEAGPVSHRGTELVPMRDGVRLATEIWLPGDGAGKYPAVLMRTPYNRMDGAERAIYLAERGYALVSQDVRGREDSEGEFMPAVYEALDGEDTLDWLASQPWCDGSVGMIGGSYLGRVQWQAASTGHPALKALVSQVTAGGPFVDSPRPGGTFSTGFLAWMFMMSERRTAKEKMSRSDWPDLLASRPLRDIPERALGQKIPFWEEWVKHPDYDGFWEGSDWAACGDKIDVPALLISGWYDDDGMGTLQAWEMNASRGRKNQRMVLGPWIHSYNTARCVHGVSFGPDALRYDLDLLALRWFERFLKGVRNGVESPAVEYYAVGENSWKESPAWPPDDARPTPLYLHSGGRANGSSGDGALSFDAPGPEPDDTYLYDPDDPAPQLIDMAENEMAVPEDYREAERRDDVLVYTTAPLSSPLPIAGNVTAVLYAASDAPDTDWLVRLTDVDANGRSIRLVDAIIQARYRESWSEPKLLVPGETVRYEIRLPHIANTFLEGHRIRVHVTSSAANLTFPNPNTGRDVFTETEARTARQRVSHRAGAASCVILPVCGGAKGR
ncbi:MAG: CocE/NonD family hydrolase [Synergistaceae bacterium]|jgi:putative CocE/NonD family hydrolase|nr:CocE/NonD family hydrolase [Synergistaceae bacterium]